MRKTVSQLILLLAFLCIAWISVNTIWKSTAAIPDGFTSGFAIGDTVSLRGDPNPNRRGQWGPGCLDVIKGARAPSGSIGKVSNTSQGYVVVTCATGNGVYSEGELKNYSMRDNCNPKSRNNKGAIERADKCRCLPGYVPFKTDCGGYICKNLADASISRNCY